jgi:hypothetical protein
VLVVVWFVDPPPEELPGTLMPFSLSYSRISELMPSDNVLDPPLPAFESLESVVIVRAGCSNTVLVSQR